MKLYLVDRTVWLPLDRTRRAVPYHRRLAKRGATYLIAVGVLVLGDLDVEELLPQQQCLTLERFDRKLNDSQAVRVLGGFYHELIKRVLWTSTTGETGKHETRKS